MQNEVWERFGQFLNRLRCENVTRKFMVKVPGYKETQNETESLRKKCEIMLQLLPKEQKQLLLDWMGKMEDMNSLEGQKAYCQGYVDCVCLLSAMGLLKKDLSQEDIIEWIK